MAFNSTLSSIITILSDPHVNVISSKRDQNNVTDLFATNVESSGKNESLDLNSNPPANQEIVIILSILFFFIGAVGLLGNFLVIIVVLLDRKMRQSVTNIFIMNLAVADFFIMLFGIPEIVQFMMNRGWLLGTVVCKINRFVLVVALYVSILSLVSVCIERFVAIVYPIKAHILCGRRKIIITVLIIWPIAIGCGLPTAIYNTLQSPQYVREIQYCMIVFPDISNLVTFRYMEFLMFYFIPVAIQIVLYAVISRKLYVSTDKLHTRFQMRPDSKHRTDRASDTIRARKDVVKMLVASVLVYLICYAPPQIILFYNTFSKRQFHSTWSFQVFSYVIAYINSAANPVLYCIFSQNFRRNFKKCLCFMCVGKSKEYEKILLDSFESRELSQRKNPSRTTFIQQ
ncbi:hypothetical protein CHS0354_036740 [Potamilus streckersoni]|uniref:G-protein coupled receptors family 1 profile domain-containing protein n=1 Tax=Potamilus streckersoni TaxID=2493646 RepID=A0AAE0TCN2_9BIVA|nr:hypothetical protein CHS0354_036740 [Potamilus streckersoni]